MNVKTLCLAVLSLGDHSGYEIKKALEDGPIGYFFHAGFGSIYPALNGLSNEGLVSFALESQEGRPDKKVYTLTPAGRDALADALARMPAPDKIRSESLLMLFFSDLLAGDHLDRIYDDYLARCHQRLAAMQEEEEECLRHPGQRFVHEVGLAVYGALIESMERNKSLFFGEDAESTAA